MDRSPQERLTLPGPTFNSTFYKPLIERFISHKPQTIPHPPPKNNNNNNRANFSQIKVGPPSNLSSYENQHLMRDQSMAGPTPSKSKFGPNNNAHGEYILNSF